MIVERVGMRNGKKQAKTTNITIKTGDLLNLGGIKKLERGKGYLDDGRILALEFLSGDSVRGMVFGEKKYSVNVAYGDVSEFSCSCPSFNNDGFCKHCVAVILGAEQGVSFETISMTYVRRLIGGVNRISNKVQPNPGVKIVDSLEKMGGAKTGSLGFHGGYRYRQTEKGFVIWGGTAAEILFDKFDLLRLKKGFRMDGYYFYDGMGGNFRPVILPSDMTLPDWTDDFRNPVFEPEAIEEGLDVDIDQYIIHDKSPKSYFQKSIFLRELHGIGAFWHGCSDWHIKGIVLEKSEVFNALKPKGLNFTEFQSTPEFMLPKISYLGADSVEVSFYFLSGGLGSTKGLFQLFDIHSPSGTVKSNQRKCIINMGQGPIP